MKAFPLTHCFVHRALDGDAVAVELLPEAQWRAPSKVLPSAAAREQAADAAGSEANDAASTDVEPDGGHIAQARAGCSTDLKANTPYV